MVASSRTASRGSAPSRTRGPLRGGSGTQRNTGSENSAHHTAVNTNEARMAAKASAKPKTCGLAMATRAKSSATPPPR